LDKEFVVDPPQGDVLLLDLVARLPLLSARDEAVVALVHIRWNRATRWRRCRGGCSSIM
jgi:hypothetical protein